VLCIRINYPVNSETGKGKNDWENSRRGDFGGGADDKDAPLPGAQERGSENRVKKKKRALTGH